MPLKKSYSHRTVCFERRHKEGGDEDQSFGVLGRHLETRAEFTISMSSEAVSAAEGTGGLPCVDSAVGEEVAGTGAEEERRRLDEGHVRTKISMLGGASGDTCRIDDFD